MICTALVAFMLSPKGYLEEPTPMLYVSKLPYPPHPPTAPAVHPFALAAAIWLHILLSDLSNFIGKLQTALRS